MGQEDYVKEMKKEIKHSNILMKKEAMYDAEQL